MPTSKTHKLMAPSRKREIYSRTSAFLKFEGDADDTFLSIKLEAKKFGKGGSDGSKSKAVNLTRKFEFSIDPLHLGASVMLAAAGIKNEVSVYSRGREIKKIEKKIKRAKAGKNQKEPDRKVNVTWEKDKNTLWELQTLQTQRTKRIINSFIHETSLVAGNLMSNIESGKKINPYFQNQLENLVKTAENIQTRRESSLFEMKLIPILTNAKRPEFIRFDLDEVGAMSLASFCSDAAQSLYGGDMLFFGGIKMFSKKGKKSIATGSVFLALSEEQRIGIKVACQEFLEFGHIARHLITGGINITSPPIITKNKDMIDGRELWINIRDRIATLKYFEAAKMYLYL